MKASLSDDRRTVTLQGLLWANTFPVAELPRWLKFYRGLATRPNARTGGNYGKSYGDTVAELERVSRELEGP